MNDGPEPWVTPPPPPRWHDPASHPPADPAVPLPPAPPASALRPGDTARPAGPTRAGDAAPPSTVLVSSTWPSYLPRPPAVHATPPPVRRRTISREKAAIWIVGTLVTVIVGGLLVAGWPGSGRPSATRPGVGQTTPSANPQRTPFGPTAAPYPSPDPLLLPSAAPGAKVLRIGVSMPLSGGGLALGGPARDGVLAALVNAGSVNGYVVQPVVLDYWDGGSANPDRTAENIRQLAADPTVMGVVGPLDSDAARIQIPVANANGLLECSPGATDTTLTRGVSAQRLRSVNPTKPTFLRVAANDDSEAVAMALWAAATLHDRPIGVVSDSTSDGLRLANAFQTALTDQHGVLAGRFDGTLHITVYTPTLASWTGAAGVFYGGTSRDAAATIRRQMDDAGLSRSMLLTTDGVYDGAWVGDSVYMANAGDNAGWTRAARSLQNDYSGREGFENWYLHTARQPVGDYSAAAFACAQVILDAIGKVSATGQPTRESVRQAAMDPSVTVQSVFGQLRFDENGDNRSQMVTVYGADPRSNGLAWQVLQQFPITLCTGSLNAPCWPNVSPSTAPSASPEPSASASPSPTPEASASPSVSPSPSPSGASTGNVIRIGVSVPLTGDTGADGRAVRDGVLAALVRAGSVHGYTIEPVPMDYSEFDYAYSDLAVSEMARAVGDPSIVAVVGPIDLASVRGMIPISNAAGLLECSPSASETSLTVGPWAARLRTANPAKTSFIRVSATTASESAALATWAASHLLAKGAPVAVISDSTEDGLAEAGRFASAWRALGGRVAVRTNAPTETQDYTPLIKRWPNVAAVFFGGTAGTGATLLRQQLTAAGLDKVPLLAPDGIYPIDPSSGGYVTTSGPDAQHSITARALQLDWSGSQAFNTWFRSTTGTAPGELSAAAYACTEVILAAIRKAASEGHVTREAVRAAATNPSTRVQTIFGATSFDRNGDIRSQVVTVYTVDWNGGVNVRWKPAGQVRVTK